MLSHTHTCVCLRVVSVYVCVSVCNYNFLSSLLSFRISFPSPFSSKSFFSNHSFPPLSSPPSPSPYSTLSLCLSSLPYPPSFLPPIRNQPPPFLLFLLHSPSFDKKRSAPRSSWLRRRRRGPCAEPPPCPCRTTCSSPP